MESAWALVCTKYLVAGLTEYLKISYLVSSIYSVMGWVTPSSHLINGDQFAMKLGCVGKMSNDQKPSLW